MLQFLLGVEGALRAWMVRARCALLPVQQPHVQRSLQLFCGSLLRLIFETVEPESFAYIATYSNLPILHICGHLAIENTLHSGPYTPNLCSCLVVMESLIAVDLIVLLSWPAVLLLCTAFVRSA